jgi:prefoldin alpha subunit
MNREKLIEIELINQQGSEIQQYLQHLDTQLQEIGSVISALDDLTGVKQGSEVLLPVTSGIFVKGTIHDGKNLIVNVGENTMVEKSIDETKDLLAKQKAEIETYRRDMMAQFQQMITRLSELKDDIKAEQATGKKVKKNKDE